jgi:ribosome-binding factor A
MDDLLKLIDLCKCGVYITINEHRDNYEKLEQRLADLDRLVDINDLVLSEMIKLDKCVEIQFYPETPIGFHIVYHHDLKKAIDEALSILSNKGE